MKQIKTDKKILDCCCGSRMFWFQKQNEHTLYTDIRELEDTLCDGRKLSIKPDLIVDFREMPFDNDTFKLVVFDPPHFEKLGKSSLLAKKYGTLLPTWKHDIKQGFNECMRVLEPYGTLIFKWNEVQISVRQVLDVIDHEPLFGHPTAKSGKTKWITFMKQPETL